jgi:nitrogen fixation/metabolism regulation signal transduction histidine kinase
MDNPFKPTEVIRKGYLTRLLLLILGVFIIGTVLSTIYLYLDIYRPLNTHYSAILSIITEIKETLIIKTLSINAFFYLLISAGIAILGILYTHRIAGPLHRIKLYAKMIGEGRLDTEIKFRHKDAIHSFGESFNDMTKSYSDRVTVLTSEIQQFKDAIAEIKSLTEDGKDTEFAMKKVLEQDSRIRNLLNTIKL